MACCGGAQAVKNNVIGNNAIMRSICNSPSNDAEIVCLNEPLLLVLVDELTFEHASSFGSGKTQIAVFIRPALSTSSSASGVME